MSGAAERPATPNDLFEAAGAYGRLGWRIHPIRPREKLPILKDWPARASSDRELIERWFGRSPEANLAVATGPKSGIFVLDVDGPEGERALVELEHRHGPLPDLYPMQWTGGDRSGWQAFFSWPEGRTIHNSAGRLGPKLDTRGDGGYVLLPPSIHPSGGRYRWAQDRAPWNIPPEPAPWWLLDLLDPPAPTEQERVAPFPMRPIYQGGEDRYATKALRAELALVAIATQGTRNDQLNASAHALFRLVAAGRLYRDIVERGLLDAARYAGLPEIEARRTIASAARSRGIAA